MKKTTHLPWDILKSDIILHWLQNTKISMTFRIDIFQFHCKNDHKQVKRNKIKRDMCKSDSIFP